MFVSGAFAGPQDMAAAAKAFGASAVAERHDLRSGWAQDQEYALGMASLPPPPASIDADASIVSIAATPPVVTEATIAQALHGRLVDYPIVFAEDLPSFVRPEDDYRLADPRRGFIPASLVAYAIPAGMEVAGGSYVVQGHGTISIPCTRCALVRAAAIGGPAALTIAGATGRHAYRLAAGWHWLSTAQLGGGPLTVSADGSIAIAGAAEVATGVRDRPDTTAPGRARLIPAHARKQSPSKYVVDDVAAGSTVALSERFDPRWTASGACDHTILLSWENGWRFCRPQTSVTLSFGPQSMLDVFLWIQGVCIIGCALWWLRDAQTVREGTRA